MIDIESVDVENIIAHYGGDRGMLIPMMQDLQAACGYLPQPKLRELAGGLAVPLTRVYSVASFYSSFRLMPKGDHTIQLCMGTVCFLKGADRISAAIQKEFNLIPGGTSPDGKFTYAPVNCVGACALAPVMVVDGEYFGGLTVDRAVEQLHEIATREKPAESDAAPGRPMTPSSPSAAEPFSAKTPKKKTLKKKKPTRGGEQK